jgi:hypothetical protein
MKRSYRPAAACAAVLASLAVCLVGQGQTMVDLQTQARNIDFSGAVSTRPFPVGATLPPVCTIGQTYFRSDARPGHNLYLCAATNSWAPVDSAQPPQGGVSGTVTVTDTGAGYSVDVNPANVSTRTGNNTYSGRNDFGAAASLRVVVSSTKPTTDCDGPGKVGQIVLRTSTDPALQASTIYMCQATSPTTFGWKVSSYSYGSGRPQSCDAGEIFFDLTAPAGQQWFGCVSQNTWATLGGAGSSLPAQSGNTGKLLGTNGATAGWRALRGFTDDGSQLIPDGTILGELSGNNIWTGQQYFPASATQTLASAGASVSCNRRTVAISSATALTLTSAATIPDGLNGQACVIVNVGTSAITFQSQNVLVNSNLQLAADRVTLQPKSQLTLHFNSSVGDWIEEVSPVSGGLKDTTATGMVAQTGTSGATVARTITGANGITVANGNGVAGDPTISLPGNSRGDLIVHDGTKNIRFGTGADGQVLTADSTIGSGLKWSSPAAVALPTTTKGDVIVHNGTANARLATGIDGQVLTADSTTTTGLKWAAPAAPLPTTTRGDIIVFDGSLNTRLGTGTSGQVLAVDPTALTGLKWTTPATVTLPGTTKGDLIVYDGAANTRLAAGTLGQSLIADPTQPSGLKWGSRSVSVANGLSITNGDWSTGTTASITMPGTTKGDLHVHNGTTNVRFAAGADGQTLVADSTQVNGLKWATRNVTGLNGISIINGDWVTGTTASIGMPGTTKGDLHVHNGTTNVRFGIGADGQTLVADSTQTNGMKWAARSVAVSNGLSITNGDWSTGTTASITLPGTTKGDLMVHNGSANTRLAAGTDGQTLIADATQPNGLKWGTRSVTGLNGISITNGDWSTGTTASITMPGTTKGDLHVHNGTANVRLPVGTNGQVLIADSTSPNGVSWAPVPASTGTRFTWIARIAGIAGPLTSASATSLLPVAGTISNGELGVSSINEQLLSSVIGRVSTVGNPCVRFWGQQPASGALTLTLWKDTNGNNTFASTGLSIIIPAATGAAGTATNLCTTGSASVGASDNLVWRAVNSATSPSVYMISTVLEVTQ